MVDKNTAEKRGDELKGVILAGGTGSRLRPLTSVTNKHLLPIYDKPMIFYPLQTLKDAGITEILVITGNSHAGDIFGLLGSGKDFGVHLTYRVQDEAGGIPQAIGLAENFVGNEKFVSINGDNIILGSIRKFAEEFGKGNERARILLYSTTTEEARKAGVVEFDRKDPEKIINIVEKPANPPTNWVSVGVYMYTPDVFKVIRGLKPSKRGELEIVDVNSHYMRKGKLKASKMEGKSWTWMDAGSFEELYRANSIIEKSSK